MSKSDEAKSTKRKLCLNMIVKNEAHVIESVLECMSKYIDYYIISDTGSTDDTKKIIKDYFDNINIEGEIHDDEWKNFGYNRTKALEHCVGKVEYCWVIDADDLIVGEVFLPDIMDKDSYNVIYGKDFCYRRKQIFKTDKNWRYIGVLHEYPGSDTAKTEANLEGNYYIDSRRLGDRNKNPNKYRKDVETLLKGLEDEPNNDRYYFYLAQSYMDDHQYENSNKYYLKRFNMGGWAEEQYFSLFKIGENNIKMKKSKDIIVESLLRAHKFRPTRLEALYELVNYLFYNEENKNIAEAAKYAELGINIPITQDVLFVSMYLYEHKFLDVASLAFFYNQEFDKSRKCINIMLERQKYPLDQLSRYEKNRGFCIPHIINKLVEYPEKKIKCITKNIEEKFSTKILFTMTTCKRIDLFINTMNSFINCCKDIELIDKFICIDDNSSSIDRKLMKEKYPFIDFIYKDSSEKGHCISMNKILDLIDIYNVKYLIHLEDDWNFYAERKYIIDSIKIIENTINIKQVLFNKNYAELYNEHSINIAGGIRKTVGSSSYIEHEHYEEGSEELAEFYNRIQGKSSCAYWPHFSFRPSVIDCKVFRKIGKYRTTNGHFEMDYSKRFYEKGYKSAFFESLSCYHTGKLTSESNNDKPNAYNLNNVCQFTAKENITLDIKDKKGNIKIINLKRREDRKENMIKKLQEANISNYEFIEAVDGQKLEATKNLEKLFRNNDFGSRRGVIGAALSHYNLWKELIEDDEYNYYIIMEDDINFCKDFKEKFNKIKNKMEEKEFLFLGYSMFDKERNEIKKYNETDNKNIIIQNLNRHIYIGGYFTYSINKIGAKKLLNYIKNNGIKHGIDYLNKIIPNLENSETVPQLTFTKWNEGGTKIDSDIQNDYESIDFSQITKNLDKFIFVPNKDIIGYDISHKNGDKYELADIAIENDKCIAFNTAGYFKDTVSYLEKSIYFKDGDGIYIKKHIYEKNEQIFFEKNVDIYKDEYLFFPLVDWGENDCYYEYNSLFNLMKIGIDNEKCVGFNTLGFFKDYIDIYNLKHSGYFGANDGLYIKKKYYEKVKNNTIRVKMLCNWCSSEQLCKEWSNMCENNFKWKNIEITWEDTFIDYYVIINYPPKDAFYIPEKTIVFQMEPWVMDDSKQWGVKTWGEWAEPSVDKFLQVRGRKTNYHNNAFWQLELNYNELLNLKYDNKLDKLSSLCSSFYFDPGHIARIDFLKFLETKGDVEMDIYSYDNKHNFKNFKGPLYHYKDKAKGYLPYKYYFMVENNYEKNFITEKLWEPILCETLVFYYGCPNANDYIDEDAYVLLDMNDFEKSYNIIKRAISEDWWTQRISTIKREKQKILNELQFFPVIKNVINNHQKQKMHLLNFLNLYKNHDITKLTKSNDWIYHSSIAEYIFDKLKPNIIFEVGTDWGHFPYIISSITNGTIYSVDNFDDNKYNEILAQKTKLLEDNLLNKDNINFINENLTIKYCEEFDKKIDILHFNNITDYIRFEKNFNILKDKINDDCIILIHNIMSKKNTIGKFFSQINGFYKIYSKHTAGLGILSKNKDIIDDIYNNFSNDINNPVYEINNYYDDNKKQNYCFIHSCTLENKGTKRLDNLINYINNKPNFLNSMEKIFINNIGIPIDIDYGPKIQITNYSDNTNLYEKCTLNKIKNFSENNPDANILYMHNKGISYDDDNVFVNDWINYMLYFLIDKYEYCIHLLNNYNTIGVNYHDLKNNAKHYSGNFWWSNSDYLKNLDSLDESKEDKAIGELWLLNNLFSNNKLKYYCLHYSNVNHYHQKYSSINYITE